MSQPDQATTAPLAERYGNTPQRRRRGVVFVLAAAAAFVVAFTAWVVWAGLDGTNATIEAKDTAHTVLDDRHVEVSFQLTAPPNTQVACAVQALNGNFAIVGWKLVDIAPSEQHTRTFTETVRTTELASTGLIYDCWLP